MSDQTPDISAILEQAQALQEQLVSARQAAAEQLVEGQAASGKVAITVTGGLDFRAVRIAPELVEDVEMLEDLVLAALHDATDKVGQLNQAAMGDIFGDAE